MSGLRRFAPRIRARVRHGLLIHFISFLVFAFFAFQTNQLALLRLDDGNTVHNLANEHFAWDRPTLGYSAELFQSLGNMEFPLNYYLIPEVSLPAMLNGWKVQPVLTYTLLASTLFLAIYLLSRTLEFRSGPALLAAWGMPLLIFPYVHDGLIYQMLTLNPVFAWSVTMMLLIVAMFWRIGRRGHTALAVPTVLVLVYWTTIAYPLETALTAPVALLFACAGVAGAGSRRERFWKLGFSAFALALAYFSGLAEFLLGVFAHTASADFGADMTAPFAKLWFNISVLFQYHGFGPAGPLLFVLGLAGAIASLISGMRSQRAAAAGLIACVLVAFGVGGVLFFLPSYSAIAPLYYELVYLPFYAIFAAGFIGSLLTRVFRWLRVRLSMRGAAVRLPRPAALLPFLAALPWLLVPEVRAARQWPEYPYPPLESPLVSRLHQEIGLVPGQDFRGRVMTATGIAEVRPQSWLDMVFLGFQLWGAWGNDHRMNGLWYYGIPTLFEYSPVISPFFYRATRDLLARPGDRQMRNIMTLRRFDPAILRLFGVRFLIADAPLPAPARLIQTAPPPPRQLSQLQLGAPPSVPTLLLYELDGANLGDYSPTETVIADDADAALAFLRSGADLRRVAAFEKPPTEPLVPASSARIVTERGGLRVLATSASTSLVILPFEYSHCLTLEPLSPLRADPPPRLMRADLLLTGIEFTGRLDATLRYHTGPFYNADCRLTDEADARRLRIASSEQH